MAEDIVRELVSVDDVHELAVLREVAADFGLTVEDVRPRDLGVATAVFVVGAAAVVAAALRSFADRRRGGQVIDLRPGRPLARRDPELMFGLVIVIAEDGRAEIRVWEPKDQFQEVVSDVLTAITSAGGTALAEVSKAAADAVGDRGRLTGRDDTGERRS
jgi:hypothetical protein